ncbi:hypothetical protein STEG23_014167, partial [Scotinomys teguina]
QIFDLQTVVSWSSHLHGKDFITEPSPKPGIMKQNVKTIRKKKKKKKKPSAYEDCEDNLD